MISDIDQDEEKRRRGRSDDRRIRSIPFIDFLLCCYIYIDDSRFYSNDKRYLKSTNDYKRGRR